MNNKSSLSLIPIQMWFIPVHPAHPVHPVKVVPVESWGGKALTQAEGCDARRSRSRTPAQAWSSGTSSTRIRSQPASSRRGRDAYGALAYPAGSEGIATVSATGSGGRRDRTSAAIREDPTDADLAA